MEILYSTTGLTIQKKNLCCSSFLTGKCKYGHLTASKFRNTILFYIKAPNITFVEFGLPLCLCIYFTSTVANSSKQRIQIIVLLLINYDQFLTYKLLQTGQINNEIVACFQKNASVKWRTLLSDNLLTITKIVKS